MSGEGSPIGVGNPAWMKLNLFGQLVREAFPGAIPYLVGSAATGKEWRDVDVRVMLDPAEWERFVGEGWTFDGDSETDYATAKMEAMTNARPTGRRRTALQLAFAELGRQMTGLPIDFQFQWEQGANDQYGGNARVALGGVVGDRSGNTDRTA